MSAPISAPLLALVLVLGCPKQDDTAAQQSRAATADGTARDTPAADACGPERAKQLEALLLDGCTTAPVEDARPLALARWKATHTGSLAAPAIVVKPSGPELYGRPLALEEVPSVLAQARSYAEPGSPAFVLAIHRDATIGSVQPVLAALAAADAKDGVLLFGSSTLPKTPPAAHPEIHARLSGKLDAMPPEERAIGIAKELETLVAPCAPIKDAFTKVATEASSERCSVLMGGVAKGVVTCGCPSWTPELVSWLQVMTGPADAPRIHADAVTLGDAQPIRAARSATWASIVDARDAPLSTLWLAPTD